MKISYVIKILVVNLIFIGCVSFKQPLILKNKNNTILKTPKKCDECLPSNYLDKITIAELNIKIIIAKVKYKPYINRVGTVGSQEPYLHFNNKDYFIKFCKRDAFNKLKFNKLLLNKPYLKENIRVEVLITKGAWDDCYVKNFRVQSRIGEYVKLFRVFEK